MPNKNYESGRRFEYRVIKYLRKLGFVATRAAGSHSPFDIIASNEKNCLHIQCKTKRPTNPKTTVINFLDTVPNGCIICVCYKDESRNIVFDCLGNSFL